MAVVNIFIVFLFQRNPPNCPSTSASLPCGIVNDVFLPSLTVMTNVEVFKRYCCSRIRNLLSCSVGRGVPRFRAATLGIEWFEYSTGGLFGFRVRYGRVARGSKSRWSGYFEFALLTSGCFGSSPRPSSLKSFLAFSAGAVRLQGAMLYPNFGDPFA